MLNHGTYEKTQKNFHNEKGGLAQISMDLNISQLYCHPELIEGDSFKGKIFTSKSHFDGAQCDRNGDVSLHFCILAVNKSFVIKNISLYSAYSMVKEFFSRFLASVNCRIYNI